MKVKGKKYFAVLPATALMTLGLAAAPAQAATVYVNNLTGGSTDPDCLAATNVTIQSGVTAAADGDTVVVCPGLYPETVTLPAGKSLSLVATGDVTVNGGGGTAFTINSVGSSIDGFTLTGATNTEVQPAVFVQGDGALVRDNTFTGNNAASIIVANSATFQNNTVINPTGPNPSGFFFNSGFGSSSTVHNNTFTGAFTNAAINVANPNIPAAGLAITNNTANIGTDGNFAVLGGTRALVIRGNTVNGSPDAGTAILLLGDDAGYSITENRISGFSNASAVSLSGGFGYPVNGSGEISRNAFKNNLRGVNVTSATGTITARLNILVGNNQGGTPDSPSAAIRNTTNASVSAANNYYGCNGGPGAEGCDEVLGNVNINPFLVLSTTIADATLTQGQATQFTADLNHNSAGNLVNGTVLDNVETATFTFNGGTVNPPSRLIVNGTASTTITAGSTSGTYSATAQVENSTSSKTVTISGGSTPTGRPSIRINDASTSEGNSGTKQLSFPVNLSKTYNQTVTVRYTTANGSATTSDYVAESGTVTFSPGQRYKSITIGVRGDRTREPSETFFVTLNSPTNATIADPNGSGVITNDDR